MKKIVLFFLLTVFSTMVSAQGQNMREMFTVMPDSLCPYLTHNHRLDMMDFMDAKMKAAVTNLFEGESEMTALTDDSLSLKMNPCLSIDMWLTKADTSLVVHVRKTYLIDNVPRVVVEESYDSHWHLLKTSTVSSSLLWRDEEIKERPHL